ncbi:MAG: AMP-dependent synthetase [Alphaproteobacteria bacterium BRH_c36]|nr:MAG: AMP-dependent synthetase [Alphaproteobacteria bacterium BRH_c36]
MARYCLAGAAATTPDKPALIVVTALDANEPDEIWTFAELEDAVLRIAAGLRCNGLQPGDRLLIQLDNTPLYPIVFFGAQAAGIVPLPASSTLTPTELEFLLFDSRASALAIDGACSEVDVPAGVIRFATAELEAFRRDCSRANWADTRADDPGYLIYTSGTTSRPKGVLHAHRAAWGRRPMYQGWYGINPDDRMLHAGAFNWTYTLGTGLTDPWANGATAIIYNGEKSPQIWPSLIEKTRATLFAAVPGLFRQILKYADTSPRYFTTLRHALTAGEAPPPGLFDAWYAQTGTQLYEALGMSEISTYISSSPAVPRKPGTVGKPQLGRAVAILPVESASRTPLPAGAEGLIAVHRSDPGLMLGYWNRPDEQGEVFRGDWFVGGDLGRIDEDGYVTHLGRANDLMKAQGYRVAPQEVEAALVAHPRISEVACTELRVRDDLSVIAAFIVPVDWNAPPAADDILAFAAERLAPYKRPREIRFVKSLPRTPNGKVTRSRLASPQD